MKAIILAAGMGRRMWPLTRNTPKCLIEIESGVSVLESQLEVLKKFPEIKKVVLVLGYLVDQVETKIKKYTEEMNIEIVYNPFYDSANNFVSLWTAMHEVEDKILIINGDDIFKDVIIKKMIEDQREGIIVSISKKDKYEESDMKVSIEDNKVKKISKQIPVDQAHGESIGIIKVSGMHAINNYLKSKKELIRHPTGKDIFWLEIFNNLVDNHNYPLQYLEFEDSDWAEIDFHVDRQVMDVKFKQEVVKDIIK